MSSFAVCLDNCREAYHGACECVVLMKDMCVYVLNNYVVVLKT